MKRTTNLILGGVAVVLVSVGVSGLTARMMMPKEQNKSLAFDEVFQTDPNVRMAAFDASQMQPVDLTKAAENSVNAVVHIKSTQESKTETVTVRDPFYDFFGDMFGNRGGQQRQVQTPERVGFGSGVIISKANPQKRSQFGLQAATRLHEAGIASNRGSACHGEYVPGPCTHRPSHHESREHPKSVV